MRAYEKDFAGWAKDTARAICNGDWSEIDRAALAEEVESLGKEEQRRLVSHLAQLLMHVLKQRYQPAKAGRSWELTILEQRRRALKLLSESPSLNPCLRELISDAYLEARYRAIKETGLETFPEEMPFSDAEIWGK